MKDSMKAVSWRCASDKHIFMEGDAYSFRTQGHLAVSQTVVFLFNQNISNCVVF